MLHPQLGTTCRLFMRAFPEYRVLPFAGAIITTARHTPRIAGVARYAPTKDCETEFYRTLRPLGGAPLAPQHAFGLRRKAHKESMRKVVLCFDTPS